MQQVLDNLALAVAKPASLPYFSLPTQGNGCKYAAGKRRVHSDLGFHYAGGLFL